MSPTSNSFLSPLAIVRVRGDGPITIPLVDPDSGLAFDPFGHNLLFTLKARASDPDASARVQKSSSVGGLTVADPAVVTLVPEDYENLVARQTYYFDIQAQLSASPHTIKTVALGTILFEYDITQEVTLSIPTVTTNPAAGYGWDLITGRPDALTVEPGEAGGVATLDEDGLVPAEQLPPSSGSAPVNSLVFVGDSTSAADGNNGVGVANMWPTRLRGLVDPFQLGNFQNSAVSGQTSAAAAAAVSTQITPYAAASGETVWLFVLIGTNSLAGTSSAIIANLQTIYAAGRAAGMTVVALTIPPRTDATVGNGKETVRLAVNAWITGTAVSTYADAYYDLAAELTPATNRLFFDADGIHHTAYTGHAIAHGVAARIFGAAVPSSSFGANVFTAPVTVNTGVTGPALQLTSDLATDTASLQLTSTGGRTVSLGVVGASYADATKRNLFFIYGLNGSFLFFLNGSGDARVVGTLTAGSAPTTLTDSAGKILAAALNTVGVPQGGTGIVSFTKGDLLVATGSTTLEKLPVGTNGQVLTCDSDQTSGLKYSTVSGTGDVTAAAAFGNDNRVIRSNGIGKGVQESGITLDDSDNLSGVAGLTATTLTVTNPIALGTPASGTLSNCTVDGTELLGYRGVPQLSKSADYTLVLGDAGKGVYHPASDNNARTFTIPANSSVAFPVGTVVKFLNLAAASASIAITSDTLTFLPSGGTGTRTLAQYGEAFAEKVASTTWVIRGNSALT